MRLLRCMPPPRFAIQKPPHRTFLPNPFGDSSSQPIQTLSASRTLPYPRAAIYTIIADVSSYSSFLPFCTTSTVTRWSAPDATGKKWPSEASLTVGWSGIEEAFLSRIYCVPGRVVESVGGASETSLRDEDIRHHLQGQPPRKPDAGSDSQILTHLLSRWTLEPVAGAGGREEQTDVQLELSFAFANPLYSAMSSAVTPKVAGVMIEAFEKRVHSVLGKKRPQDGRFAEKVNGAVDQQKLQD
jgi:coenzyme Q-binding protein COQ10